ncbi:binding-protein-dependent transport protein [Mycobacteroides abscessus subsp. abscessus]|nr:binding-protein-dependent transport protein [Mycobacteroides abscessus subsp. abscessus]
MSTSASHANQEPKTKRSVGKGPSLWLLTPAFAFFVFFCIVPLIGVFILSLTKWDGIGTPEFVGLQSWQHALTNDTTLNAIKLTVLLTIFSYLVQCPLSLLLGTFMAGEQKYREFLSVMYFLPMLFSAAAIGIAFKALLDPNFGLSNAFGAKALSQDYLGQPNLAFYVVILVISWQFVPFHSLLYQAGVRQIPKTMYEAAQIDGAGRIKQFFSITLPQLKYTIVTSSTLMIVGSLTYFDLIFTLTQGGPGIATRILPLDMYLLGFRSNLMGPASAVAVLLVVVGLILSLSLQKLSGSDSMESQSEGA